MWGNLKKETNLDVVIAQWERRALFHLSPPLSTSCFMLNEDMSRSISLCIKVVYGTLYCLESQYYVGVWQKPNRLFLTEDLHSGMEKPFNF